MNHRGFIAVIPLIGAIIGLTTLMAPWVLGYSGIDLLEGSMQGFQRFLPAMVAALSVAVALLSVCYILGPRWFIPFFTFFLGVAMMILTSIFTMWDIDGVKAMTESGFGVWMSYASGAVILLGSAFCYKAQFRAYYSGGQ